VRRQYELVSGEERRFVIYEEDFVSHTLDRSGSGSHFARPLHSFPVTLSRKTLGKI
jgi:hypothetical protein